MNIDRFFKGWKKTSTLSIWNGGVIPLGYKRDPKNKGTLLIDRKEAVTVKAMFDIFLRTKNLRQTCTGDSFCADGSKENENRNLRRARRRVWSSTTNNWGQGFRAKEL